MREVVTVSHVIHGEDKERDVRRCAIHPSPVFEKPHVLPALIRKMHEAKVTAQSSVLSPQPSALCTDLVASVLSPRPSHQGRGRQGCFQQTVDIDLVKQGEASERFHGEILRHGVDI